MREEVLALLAQAEATDTAEDAQYGANGRGDELPAELRRRESRLQRIREAKRVLEARAKEKIYDRIAVAAMDVIADIHAIAVRDRAGADRATSLGGPEGPPLH